MGIQARRVVLIPRYTSFAGPESGSLDLFTAPVPARAFTRADLAAWKNTGIGSGSIVLTLQGSMDLATWIDRGTITTTADAEAVTAFDPLDCEWIRVKITLTDKRVTCWLMGEFAVREA
jgi:hypothetical protein